MSAKPAIDLLTDALSRTKQNVHAVTDGLTGQQLSFRPGPDANSIAWLIWHLTRVQDDHVADVAGVPQVWTAKGWVQRFGLDLDDEDTGYGHDSDQVASVRVDSGRLLTGYYDEVHEQTLGYLATLSEDDLNQIVDERFNPPVTLAVRLISVIDDDAQHAGQAAYVRGLLPG